MTSSSGLTVGLLLPVLNEIDGLTKIFPLIDKAIFDQILFIDGGSTDGTIDFLERNKCQYVFQKKKGLSEGTLEGIYKLKELGVDCVIEFSPDGNCIPSHLVDVVRELKSGADLVVVSRYLPPAKSLDDSLITGFGNFIFTSVINMFGKQKITDSLNIYRGFRIDKFICNEMLQLLEGPVLEPLITIWALKNNYRVKEIPGDEPPRIGGQKKMRILYNGFCILRMIKRAIFFKIK
tara:strand:+ start:4603 stop:5307 length:705 start_codon:yes stop_codon:yes gene_type:complete